MKLIKLLIILLTAIMLSSCTAAGGQIQDLIEAPDINVPPIEGKWEITSSVYKINSQVTEGSTDYIGKEGLFHKEAVVVGHEYTTDPYYKIKKVKASDYLIYKYKISPLSLGLDSEYLQVITILNGDKYFCELLKLDEESMLIFRDDTFFKLERKVQKISIDEIQRYIDVEESVQMSFGGIEPKEMDSGILLGVKTQSFDEVNEIPQWKYSTYWIQMDNRDLETIYRLDRLLLPRKNGFWMIDQDREEAEGVISDQLIATPLFNYTEQEKALKDLSFNIEEKLFPQGVSPERMTPSILKSIIFVGNDYISVENIDLDRGDRRTLQVYAIDNLREKRPVKLSDLIGDTGSSLFAEGARNAMNVTGDITPNEENIGLARRNGYWTLKGRINFREKDEELYREFNIKAIPPKEMVSFDELSIPYDAVRLAVPDVLDVFSSPNNDFLIVITTSGIVIYSVEGYDINTAPLAKFELPNDSTVVMSEWAVDRYPDIWRNEMINQGAVEIQID